MAFGLVHFNLYVVFGVSGFFALLLFCSLADSPLCMADLVTGTFISTYFRSWEGTFAPWYFRSLELSLS